MSERCGEPGCYATNEVDVCYTPAYNFTGQATPIRVGPSVAAPIVRSETGTPVYVAPGAVFNIQSTRNPGCDRTPPVRPTDGHFTWGYQDRRYGTSKSGWLDFYYLQWAGSFPYYVCGPAGEDWDCRVQGDAGCGSGNFCSGSPDFGNASSKNGELAEVIAEQLYLRYSYQSTAFRYLVGGDRVRRRCQVIGTLADGRTIDYHCVEVVEAAWAPTGGRGWVGTQWIRDL